MVAFWRSLGSWVVAGLVISGCTVTAMNPQTEVKAIRVMPLGDSITDGFNVPGGYRNFLLPALQERGYPIEFVGSKRNGLTESAEQNHEGIRVGKLAKFIFGSRAGCLMPNRM
ncbi:MAG: hypothetical protein HC919_05605 [Oscillatoriales cyanobacterium SM2_2_1]|nr:hypothetical protein [Oscillatoriales cyanobacterium SM2_2_1]